MKTKIAIALIAAILVASAIVFVHAAPPVNEQTTAVPGKEGKTIYMDIGSLGRKEHAANKMTEMHEKMAKAGFTVIDVEPYTENGDLQGFYLTYVRK